MPLEPTLTDITGRVRQGWFQNKQAVSQGIVVPILCEPGSDIFDSTRLWLKDRAGEAGLRNIL